MFQSVSAVLFSSCELSKVYSTASHLAINANHGQIREGPVWTARHIIPIASLFMTNSGTHVCYLYHLPICHWNIINECVGFRISRRRNPHRLSNQVRHFYTFCLHVFYTCTYADYLLLTPIGLIYKSRFIQEAEEIRRQRSRKEEDCMMEE